MNTIADTADSCVLSRRVNSTQEAPYSQVLFADGRRSLHALCSSESRGEKGSSHRLTDFNLMGPGLVGRLGGRIPINWHHEVWRFARISIVAFFLPDSTGICRFHSHNITNKLGR